MNWTDVYVFKRMMMMHRRHAGFTQKAQQLAGFRSSLLRPFSLPLFMPDLRLMLLRGQEDSLGVCAGECV